ncbi:ABC transporter permease [Candidatus Sumerlaeota bacterium]|nr:ABC transporter permease [Candidatus Sumerlaeota bacterium]
MLTLLKNIEFFFFALFHTSGGMLLLSFQCVLEFRHLFANSRRILKMMLEVGWKTLPLASMIGLFTGMITALQTGVELKNLGIHEQIGTIVGLSLVREMGPVFTAFIIAARVGAAWAAEIGAMNVSEEVDALRSLGIYPVRFLAMPRFFAAITMQPVLTIYSIVVGIWGGALVSVHYLGVPRFIYYKRLFNALEMEDVTLGLLKAFVFGAIFSIVCCFMGLSTQNGAEGVGRSTTRSVVISLSLILVADYFITRFMG